MRTRRWFSVLSGRQRLWFAGTAVVTLAVVALGIAFESPGILLTVILALVGSFFVYRPFCQFICPFGFISWIAERLSAVRRESGVAPLAARHPESPHGEG